MPAAALNTFHNVLLRSVTGEDDITIVINNHPLPRNNASVQVPVCSMCCYFVSELLILITKFRLMMQSQTLLVLVSVYLLCLAIAFYLLVLCYSWLRKKSQRSDIYKFVGFKS